VTEDFKNQFAQLQEDMKELISLGSEMQEGLGAISGFGIDDSEISKMFPEMDAFLKQLEEAQKLMGELNNGKDVPP
jgi:hypothetical protein